jgi:hypothetical protein
MDDVSMDPVAWKMQWQRLCWFRRDVCILKVIMPVLGARSKERREVHGPFFYPLGYFQRRGVGWNNFLHQSRDRLSSVLHLEELSRQLVDLLSSLWDLIRVTHRCQHSRALTDFNCSFVFFFFVTWFETRVASDYGCCGQEKYSTCLAVAFSPNG